MNPDIYEGPRDFNPSRWDVSVMLRYVIHFFSSNYLVDIVIFFFFNFFEIFIEIIE
jgi:hypothetical protein